jgi:hypothetical protein
MRYQHPEDVSMADYPYQGVRGGVALSQPFQLSEGASQHLRHVLAGRDSGSAAKLVESPPSWNSIQFSEWLSGPLPEVHLGETWEQLDLEPLAQADGSCRFQGPLQGTAVQSGQGHSSKTFCQILSLALALVVQVNSWLPPSYRVSNRVTECVTDEQEHRHFEGPFFRSNRTGPL